LNGEARAYLARVPQAYSGATGEESERSRALIAAIETKRKPDLSVVRSWALRWMWLEQLA